METPFVYSREERAQPSCELLAQVRAPGGKKDYVLAVRDMSRSGALFELSDLCPPWLSLGAEVEVTLVGEGEREAAEFRGPITRVVDHGGRRGFAVQLEKPTRRCQKYFKRVISRGEPVRRVPRGLPD